MHPTWPNLRVSAGVRPKSLLISASEYSCISSPRRFLGRSPRGSSFLWSLALHFGGFGSTTLQACLERVHQIDHVGPAAESWCLSDRHFLAFNFSLNRRLNPCPMLIDILIRVKALCRELLDQLVRQFELRLRH